MRSSRVSRDTTRVIQALSPPGKGTTRRSLRQFAQSPARDSVKLEEEDSSNGSDASSSDYGQSNTSSALGKRKRAGKDTPMTSISSSTTPTRRSPRKAGATVDGSAPRKARRQPAKHIKGPNGTITTEPPGNWEEVYNMTASMRKRVLAPVDTMGCESLAERNRNPQEQRLQTLVSLMMSSQTKDTVTAAAMRSLQENLPGGFCLESLLAVEPEELNSLICKVGFHNNKTKYIKSVATILHERYNDDIPDTIEGLVGLPGVGPKMAYLCMSAAWGRDEGIGVDVHVHRITNLWGWHKTSTPEQTRAELEAWLPREKWHEINHLLVGLGQTICLPVGRRCGECDLAAAGLCPSAQVAKSSPVKKRVKKEVEVEVEVEVESGSVVKAEELVVKEDDVGVKIEADLEEEGRIEVVGVVDGESGAAR